MNDINLVAMSGVVSGCKSGKSTNSVQWTRFILTSTNRSRAEGKVDTAVVRCTAFGASTIRRIEDGAHIVVHGHLVTEEFTFEGAPRSTLKMICREVMAVEGRGDPRSAETERIECPSDTRPLAAPITDEPPF